MLPHVSGDLRGNGDYGRDHVPSFLQIPGLHRRNWATASVLELGQQVRLVAYAPWTPTTCPLRIIPCDIGMLYHPKNHTYPKPCTLEDMYASLIDRDGTLTITTMDHPQSTPGQPASRMCGSFTVLGVYKGPASMFQTRSLVTDPSPLVNTKFVLDTASVAGLLGGEEAMSTVALAQIYDRRKWLGWYNTPGSYIIGKRFRRLAHSIVPDSQVNPGSGTRSERVHVDPALLLQHDGWSKGPVFKGIYSGTALHETGPLASDLMKRCIRMSGTPVEGRTTQPVNVTIAKFERDFRPESRMKFHYSPPTRAIIPIAVSLGTCAACGWYGEWYAFSMILLGILARGLTCVFIGSGELIFDHPKPAEGSPPGDGILGCDDELVLLKGNENVVNAITRGRFFYSFESKNACQMVELCSFFLIAQAIAQLILVPQSDLFGQLMFVLSIATSWVYNLWLLSVDKMEVRNEIFRRVIDSPNLKKSVFPNRSTAIVYLLHSINDQAHSGDPEKLRQIVDSLLPSGLVWEIWKGIVIEHLTNGQPLRFDDTHRNPVVSPSNAEGGSSNTPSEHSGVSSTTKLIGNGETLLYNLLEDAETACAAFRAQAASRSSE